MKNYLIICCLLVLNTIQAQKNINSPKIQKLASTFQKMHNERLINLEKGDVEAAIKCFAEDAMLMDIGVGAKGIASIREHLNAVLSSMSLHHTENTQEGLEVSGNLAYDYGTTIMELKYKLNDITQKVASKYIAIWKKSKGQWRISKLIFNQDSMP